MPRQKHILPPDFALVFRALPGLYILLSPDLIILDATERYAQTTNFVIEDLVGVNILDSFPDNPDESNTIAQQNLKESLEHVLAHKEAHTMPVIRFDVPMPKEQGGGFQEMYWQTVNTPILNDKEKISYILHETSDITSSVLQQRINQQNEERMAMLTNTMNAVAWEYDIESDRLTWGNSLKELFGYTPEDIGLSGSSWDKYVHPDDIQAVQQSVKDATAAGDKFWTGEYRLKKADGTYVHVLDQSYILYNEQGDPIRTFGSIIDISENKRIKEDLQESDARFRHLLENLPHMACTVDPKGKILYFNDNWYSYTGMRPGQTEGWINTVHPDDSADALTSWHQTFSAGNSREIELRILNPAENTYRTFLRRCAPMQDADDNARLWICTFTDIEEQRQTTEKVRQLDQQMKQILELSPVHLCLLKGPTYTCTYVTPGIYDIYGSRNYLGRTAREIWPELEYPGFQALLDQVYHKGDIVQINEFKTQIDPYRDGQLQKVYFNFRYQPVRENGTISCILISAIEVTELVEAKSKAEKLAQKQYRN